MRRVVLATVAMLAIAGRARADQAEQLVGLFMQSCLPYAGDSAGLRLWAGQLGLKRLPPAGQAAFLQSQPGVAFDATDAAGKFVVISGDGGDCATVAERGDTGLAADLERALAGAGVGFVVTADRDDPEEKPLHHREYRASKGARAWRIVVSTGDSGAHSMLSAVPE